MTLRPLIVGGLATSLVNFRGDLIRALVAREGSVHAAAPDLWPESPAGQTLIAWGATPHAISLARTGLNPVADLKTGVELYRLCKRVEPSHVLAYTAKPVIYGLPAARLARTAHRTALITGLGYAFTAASRDAKRRLLQSLLSALYRAALRSATRVVFQNPDDQALFVDLGLVDPARCALVHGSGVNLRSFPMTALPPQPRGLRFLLIARLLRDKGIAEYVDAARRVRQSHPDAEFHVIGGHDTNPAAIARSELDRWIADSTIIYHGWRDDVRPLLAQSHVYVLPSYREGTPRTVLEAMAMGRPIITTDVPGCRETVIDGYNGYLVPARSAEALAGAMLRLIAQPEHLPRLGAASRQLVEQKFDVVQVNLRLMALMGLAPSN